MSVTPGKYSATTSGEPSVEALSTTMTSCTNKPPDFLMDSRQFHKWSRLFQLTMMTEMRFMTGRGINNFLLLVFYTRDRDSLNNSDCSQSKVQVEDRLVKI